MLTIRLQRAGKRNTPQYRLVLAQKTAANQKQFVEVLGSYNPHTKELGIRDQERLNYWMNDQHVELSETVHNLFVTKQIVKADKKKAFTIPKKEVVNEEPAAAAPESSEGSEAPAEETAPEPTTESATEESAPETTAEAPAEEVAAEPAPEVATETSESASETASEEATA